MTYTHPVNTDPTYRAFEGWAALIAADLDTTGHHQPAEQVRAINTDQDLTDAAEHIDAIAGAVDDPDLFARLDAHAQMLRSLAANPDGKS